MVMVFRFSHILETEEMMFSLFIFFLEVGVDILMVLLHSKGFLMAQSVKSLPETQESRVLSLDQENPLEKEVTTHFSTLVWRISWTEESYCL